MATTHWGRKESIIFPPHSPIYSYGAVFLAFVLTGCFLYLRFSFGQSSLQQFYTPIYARTAAGGVFKRTANINCCTSATATKAGRLAVRSDVQAGTTPAPGGKQIPLALSRSAAGQGLRALYRGPEQKYLDAPLHEYLKKSRVSRRPTAGHLQNSVSVWLSFAAGAASVLRSRKTSTAARN